MKEQHLEYLVQNLIDRSDYFGLENFNLQEHLDSLKHPITDEPLSAEVKENIKKKFLINANYKIANDSAILIPVSIISDPKLHEEWYNDWLESNKESELSNFYWKRLEKFIAAHLTKREGPELAGNIVKSIDYATDKIVRKLANPKRKAFSYKGLVIGYVQSGKTANFTALIAKAVDAGYKFVIVLAGIHNVLRQQTQIRIDKELTGENDFDLDDFIPLPGALKKWNRLTTGINDFTRLNLSTFSTYCQLETPTIAIIKKNVTVLKSFVEYISEAPVNIRDQIPVLIIDDEADQASIDTNSNDSDSDPSRTNEQIRLLLSKFKKKVYVGYTATPFANVLIDMKKSHKNLEDDLYPRNFIVSLPKPTNYFGPADIFQGELANSFVKQIPDEGNDLIKSSFITNELSAAIDNFILSCAIRDFRDDKFKPMTMLVHISHRIEHMKIIKEIISTYINDLKTSLSNTQRKKELHKFFKANWEDLISKGEAAGEFLSIKPTYPSFENVWNNLPSLIEQITTVELNSYSEDILDYSSKQELKVIAVGGNQLSRGLTLEGLMTSYYLRSSKQYDTLLQMGRWFGYRKGYEDLTRIYTTKMIWEFFEHLSLVEDELRSEVYRYEDENKTPYDFAVSIRSHRKLSITAKNKLGAGKARKISFSDQINQTTWFSLDKPAILNANLSLGESFIGKLNTKYGFRELKDTGVHICKQKVSGYNVLDDFLNKYTFTSKEETGGPGMDYENLLAYIFRRLNYSTAELTDWNVCVAGNIEKGRSVSLGGVVFNKVQRSRKFTSIGYNIGVLTDPSHIDIDLPKDQKRSPNEAQLIIYLIDKESKAQKVKTNPKLGERVDLYHDLKFEKVDVLGFAIVLPESKLEPNDYISQ